MVTLKIIPILELESPFDIFVQIKACVLNPVDTKIRQGAFPSPPTLGFDGAGIVTTAGASALFKPGDEVLYAGVMGRAGTNAQYLAVDSRVAARKPVGLGWAKAAALPLLGLTTWEMLEGHFGLVPGGTSKEETIVIISGAGGVGSMATQFARKLRVALLQGSASDILYKKVVVSASR